MAILQAVVNLPHVTDLPRDVSINTFWFDSALDQNFTRVAAAEAISSRLVDFYNEDHSTNERPSAFISSVVSRVSNACFINFYDQSDPAPRAPFFRYEWTLGSINSNASLPNEVAICASFFGSQTAGTNQARRRGRIFLGPLTDAASNSSGQQPARPWELLKSALVKASSTLAEPNFTEDLNTWVVWSRVGNMASPVVAGWVDDEFDTQRRREHGPTTRTSWDLRV